MLEPKKSRLGPTKVNNFKAKRTPALAEGSLMKEKDEESKKEMKEGRLKTKNITV